MNKGATVKAAFAIEPVTDLSNPSESRKSYLLIPVPSTVNILKADNTSYPTNDLPFNFS
jgi:hypothetical protein